MFCLYVLKSVNFDRRYIGISENLRTRLAKHNSGSVRSTKAYRPWKLIYKEDLETKREARLRELDLKKNGNKRKELFESLNKALSSIG